MATYKELIQRLNDLEKDLELATNQSEIDFLRTEILCVEEYLAKGIARTQDILAEVR